MVDSLPSALVAISVGAAAGVTVTRWLHAGTGFWSRRLRRSRFRRANLPVGGVIAAAAAMVEPSAAVALLPAAAAMTLTAVGWRYVDPLPPL